MRCCCLPSRDLTIFCHRRSTMSSTQLSSEEIAEDYKSSLEDLHFNSRYEISNLTVIAKENIHAAQAIARSIEEHINKVSLLNFLTSNNLVCIVYLFVSISGLV